MQRLLAKFHHLVGHFKHSALATDKLMRKQKGLGFKKMLHVIQETPTRWNSTFYMLQRLVLLKQPIRLYLEDTMDEVDHRSYDLTDYCKGYFKPSGICRSSDDHIVWREVFLSFMVLAIDIWLV